ncbi:MAG: ATP-binding protein [Zoogloeaceae bacterium]|jgi:hypothetical protein|nr:ATP-binding protein [Zoogloeaceae bacterium]
MFTIVRNSAEVPREERSRVFLVVDDWDDWFSFRTMFTLIVFDPQGVRHTPGSVKIGQAGLLPSRWSENLPFGTRVPNLPPQFPALDPADFFSLGQDEDYYATINALEPDFSRALLTGLCDCAFDLQIFHRHRGEMVMEQSLLRSVRDANVRNRLHRLAHGDAVLTRFEFEYTLPPPPPDPRTPPPPPTTLQFLVVPGSTPPTNVHVLVGRNGVGKTRCIQSLVNSLLEWSDEAVPSGIIRRLGENNEEWTFAGLVSVSFSAFDRFAPPPPADLRVPAAFVGLHSQVEVDGTLMDALKSTQDLAQDFVRSLARCRTEPRRTRWLRAVRTLATDPLFAEAEVEQLLELDEATWEERAAAFFGRLSSGHAIVLLTTTRLVELVDERTLVVLDEPEGHLHPPLLSAFVRAVADLLVARNGVALISTHSPVVLQEVPRSCVWMLRRTRTWSTVERPSLETFGESAGVLTREVFGLEVTGSGFHQLVSAVARQPGSTYEAVEEHFNQQLGAEARALARSLVAQRTE